MINSLKMRVLRACLLVLGVLLAGAIAASAATGPQWWTARGVLATNAPVSDYSMANQGQAKWMSTNAYLEFVERFPGDANTNLLNVVKNFTQQGNFLPLNRGQLKALVKPFYDRIYEVACSSPYMTNALPSGLSGSYPWTTNVSDDADYTPANVGQLKYAFSFDFTRAGQANQDTDYDGRSDAQELAEGTNPLDANSFNPVRLGYWRFDNTNTWAGEAGQLPLAASNLVAVPSWNTNAVLLDSANAAILKYRDVETNGNANLNLRTGTLRFWFKPDWNSAGTNSGTGPQAYGRLLESGHWTTDGSYGNWALTTDPTGTLLSFVTQGDGVSNTNLQYAVSWQSNQWHQLVLTYSPTNSALYLDGQPVVTAGMGVSHYPNATVRGQGFMIGSDFSGANQARGQFEDLETFNFLKSASEIVAEYQTVVNSPGFDKDGDGVPDKEDADPNNPNVGRLTISIDYPLNGTAIH